MADLSGPPRRGPRGSLLRGCLSSLSSRWYCRGTLMAAIGWPLLGRTRNLQTKGLCLGGSGSHSLLRCACRNTASLVVGWAFSASPRAPLLACSPRLGTCQGSCEHADLNSAFASPSFFGVVSPSWEHGSLPLFLVFSNFTKPLLSEVSLKSVPLILRRAVPVVSGLHAD